MRRLSERWLVVALIFVTGAYAVAEDITLTTYYPSPRGVYREVQWGTNAAARLSADEGASIELRGTGIPYIDFSNDAVINFDVRMILANDDTLNVDGGNLAVIGGDLSASGTVSAPTVTGNTNLCIGADCRSAWPILSGAFSSSYYDSPSSTVTAQFDGVNAAPPRINVFEWTRCWFYTNGNGGPHTVTRLAGNGACHSARQTWGYLDNNGVTQIAKRWHTMATCPAGWKVISGGAVSYATDQPITWIERRERVNYLRSSEPMVYGDFNQILNAVNGANNPIMDPSTIKHSPGVAGDSDEGWRFISNDSNDDDKIRFYVLCGGSG